MGKDVCVILPALNEEESIGKVIDEIPGEEINRRGYKYRVIVVDNGSIDKTGEISRGKGAEVIVEPLRGKGRALRTAFKRCSGDFIFIIDSDYTYPATHIPEMLEKLENGYDVVMGSRLKGKMNRGAMSKLNQVGNRLLALMTNILYGTNISDPCTGCWGMKGEVVNGLELNAVGFEIEVDMLAQIARDGHRITEIPIEYRRRETPPKLRSLRDGFRIGKMLLRKRFRQDKAQIQSVTQPEPSE
jgi:glycosyltransferase involved in cell wall biosynthesis